MMISRTWSGVVGKIDTPTADHRALSLPPLGLPDHRDYPLPLLIRTAETDRIDICGHIRKIWRNGDALGAWGVIHIDTETTWGQKLLVGTPLPVGVNVAEGAHRMQNRRGWDPVLRLVGFYRPQIRVSLDWTVCNAMLADSAAWPDAYITLN